MRALRRACQMQRGCGTAFLADVKRLSAHAAKGLVMKDIACIRCLIMLGCMGASERALAAGFQLQEQNASGLGNAYAGSAVSAEDASTIFFNPAGLTSLSGTQLVVGTNVIKPRIEFSDRGSQPALRTGPPLPLSFQPLGGQGGDAGSYAAVPSLYLSHRLNQRWGLGLAVSVPFGLKTEYDADWAGRYIARKSELKTYQINPALAYRVTDALSLAAGVSYLSASAELTNAVNFGPFGDGNTRLKGDDAAWSYNLGVLWQPSATTRLGASYRSNYKLTLQGDVATTFPGTPAQFALLSPAQRATFAAANGNASARVTLPDIVVVSWAQQIAPRWEALADVSWTRWSAFKDLQVNRDNGLALSTTPENWRNTWRIAVGVTHRLSNRWRLRAGLAYDQSPVPDASRTPRIPDSDRYWMTVGAQYQFSKLGAIDVGYAHIFVRDANINATAFDAAGNPVSANGRLIVEYNSSIDILGVQVRYIF